MEKFHLWVWRKIDVSEAVEQAVCHILTNPGRWKCKMSSSMECTQNNFRGDRWSQIWCSKAKIPLFLDLSAPPVASGAGIRSIGNKMLKLTSIYEGLSIGPSKKKPLTEVAKILLILLVFSESNS